MDVIAVVAALFEYQPVSYLRYTVVVPPLPPLALRVMVYTFATQLFPDLVYPVSHVHGQSLLVPGAV